MGDHELTPESWLAIMESAYSLFADAEARKFGTPPFSLGGGTTLMLAFKHRLSKDIDLFGHDAQWISILSPRLNDCAARLATSYVEQANRVKIVMAHGDIDFIVAADATTPVARTRQSIAGREIDVEPVSEILSYSTAPPASRHATSTTCRRPSISRRMMPPRLQGPPARNGTF